MLSDNILPVCEEDQTKIKTPSPPMKAAFPPKSTVSDHHIWLIFIAPHLLKNGYTEPTQRMFSPSTFSLGCMMKMTKTT